MFHYFDILAKIAYNGFTKKVIFGILLNTLNLNLIKVDFFVWGFLSQSRFFHSYKDVTITSEGLQIKTFSWHL